MRLIEIPDDGIVCTPIMDGESIVGERRIDLSDYPTVDAVPVVHGRWVNSQGGFWEVSSCSNCGEKYPTAGNAPNFCPNCGADMRELPEPPEEDEHA